LFLVAGPDILDASGIALNAVTTASVPPDISGLPTSVSTISAVSSSYKFSGQMVSEFFIPPAKTRSQKRRRRSERNSQEAAPFSDAMYDNLFVF